MSDVHNKKRKTVLFWCGLGIALLAATAVFAAVANRCPNTDSVKDLYDGYPIGWC